MRAYRAGCQAGAVGFGASPAPRRTPEKEFGLGQQTAQQMKAVLCLRAIGPQLRVDQRLSPKSDQCRIDLVSARWMLASDTHAPRISL